jgi:zinc transport system substrate-binding protein
MKSLGKHIMTNNTSKLISLSLIWLVFVISGCTEKSNDPNKVRLAVTNSYLQCAVEDLDTGNIDVFSLAPPGMCPGHFDITPAQVRQLRNCSLLLLFDFQSGIEKSLSGIKSKGLKTVLVQTQPGMCVPETYLDTCRQVCDILLEIFPGKKDTYSQRLIEIEKRLSDLSKELRTEISKAKLAGVKVLASGHQSKFADWLGLETLAVFSGSDSETITNINDCTKKANGQNVRFIIANKQEGTTLAESLAERLAGIQTVVFSNFPEVQTRSLGFDNLLRSNVHTLIKAAK